MPDTIKIGMTENLERRIKDLDTTGVALPFECYYAVEVHDALDIERKMHQGLDNCRIRQNREFFNTTPEQAKSLLQIAEVMGGRNVTPTTDIVETPQDAQALRKAKTRRERFNFGMLDIEIGSILTFKKDETITCEVVNETQVRFQNEITSLSNSANLILNDMGYDWQGGVQGTVFWCYNGKSLHDLRLMLE